MYKDKREAILSSMSEITYREAYQVDEIEEDFPNNFKKIDTKSLPNKDLILRVIEKDLCRYKKYAEILFCLMMTLGVLFLITAFF